MFEKIARFIPAAQWLPSYQKRDLPSDLVAGLTTAVLLVPQAMAYAMLAGLPPIIGLYAALIPLVVYALFGSSRQLAVGPVAMVSLMVAAAVGVLADGDPARTLVLAVLLSLLVGAIQFGMGVFRLGFVVNFLSHPVVSGFTSAAALIIGFSQLKHLVGVDLPRSHHVHTILISAFEHMGQFNGATLVIGIGSIGVLSLLKKKAPRFPAALLTVVAGTAAVWLFGLQEVGVKIVGDVPAGLPPLALPLLDLEAMQTLLPTALAISFVGFMESISVAKAFARKTRTEVRPNQELIGLGAANIAGAFFSAYPVTGGFSRTAVNADAGAKTPLASLITAGVVALTLMFLTPLFFYLPKAVLAANIMVAVFGLIDVREVKHLWRVKRADLALLALTFVATLTLGIEEGILVGVGASLFAFVVRSTRPHFAILGRLPGTEVYRNVLNFPDAETFAGLLILRVDAQFFFGNVTFLKDTIKTLLQNGKAPIKAVVLEAGSVNQLDSSADAALHDIAGELAERGIRLIFANVKGPVREVMRRSHFNDVIGEENFHLCLADAVRAARTSLEDPPPAGGDEEPPVLPFKRRSAA
jgi:SulP family sulfate permease